MNLPELFTTEWTDRFAFDIALRLEGSGESIGSILERHDLDKDDLYRIAKDQVFQKKVAGYREEIQEKGLTFRLKARTQAEELLKTSWIMIHDPDVNPSVRADLIKQTVRWADLEPKRTEAEDTGVAAGGVRVIINLEGATAPKTISAQTIDMDD